MSSVPPRLPISRSELGEIFKNPRTALAFEKLLQTISSPSVVFQPGDFKYSASPNAQDGWLICDHSAVSRTAYANLFAAIGTTWGAGDGVTTFNLPPNGVLLMAADGTFTFGSTGGAEPGTWSGIALEQDGGAPYALKQGATSGNHPSMPPYAAVTLLIKT